MKRIFWDRRGFTTAELLVAALFGMIVMATLYGFYREQMFNLLSQETKTATLEDARGALDMMVREMRNAGAFPVETDTTCIKDDSGIPLKIISANAASFHFQTDTHSPGRPPSSNNPDGKCSETGENVIYSLSGSTITRNGPTNPLVHNVVIPAGSDFLTYYQAGSATPLSHPISDPSVIKRIKITFSVQVPDPTPEGKAAGRRVTSSVSSSVEFRN
ncbi:hypothetical protein EPO44_22175 [bacterium]|nr:MAG: hypothetical protein EPO44_22175 [bacterium]